MKYTITIGVIFFALCILASCKTTHKAESRKYLKQYAFCRCLQYAANDSAIKSDLSLYVYQELANYDFDVYRIVDSISRIKATNIKPSIIADHEGRKAIALNCFEYYHSKMLDSLVKSMNKKIINSW